MVVDLSLTIMPMEESVLPLVSLDAANPDSLCFDLLYDLQLYILNRWIPVYPLIVKEFEPCGGGEVYTVYFDL